jgi:hypothetical protein
MNAAFGFLATFFFAGFFAAFFAGFFAAFFAAFLAGFLAAAFLAGFFAAFLAVAMVTSPSRMWIEVRAAKPSHHFGDSGRLISRTHHARTDFASPATPKNRRSQREKPCLQE